MPVNQEIWVKTIVEPFYSTYSFLLKVLNHDEYVNNRTVHVPNAGEPSPVSKNAKKFPMEVASREDSDLIYDVNVFRIAPTVIQNAEAVELSYNKRESVISVNRAELYEAAAQDIVATWVSQVEKPINGSTGTIKEHIKAIAVQFRKDKVPHKERYIMLGAQAYEDFLNELSEKEQFAFSASADSSKGVLGKYMSFEFVEENFVPENVKLIAWHKGSLAKAMGETKILSNDQDATYFGDVVSAEVRVGGAVVRKDGKGIAVVDNDGVKDAAPEKSSEKLKKTKED